MQVKGSTKVLALYYPIITSIIKKTSLVCCSRIFDRSLPDRNTKQLTESQRQKFKIQISKFFKTPISMSKELEVKKKYNKIHQKSKLMCILKEDSTLEILLISK